MKVADNHFIGDFLNLDYKFSCFQIATKLSFHDGEYIFNQLSFPISDIIEPESHFPSVCTPNDLVIPGTDGDDGVSIEVFSDKTMNIFRIIPSIQNVTMRLSDSVTLPEQFAGMPGIMDPAFGRDESGDHPLIGIHRDRGFEEMLANLAGSGRIIMTTVPTGKSRRIDCRYGNNIVVEIKQVQCFSEYIAEI